MRKVIIDNLPKKQIKNKEIINWENSIGKTVHFIYDNIEGDITILDYKQRYLTIKYSNNLFKILNYNFIDGRLGNILKIHTKDFKINIGTTFKDDKRDLIIIDREYRNNNYKNLKWYKYKCNICGWNNGWIREDHILKGVGCTCCAGQVAILGINTIWDTDKWMVPYIGMKNAKLYTKESRQKIYPICPDCGRIKDKLITISSIYRTHSIGCPCGDGISYPEKLMFNILEQLNSKFKHQLSKSNYKWCDSHIYDFYIPSKKCIIETHGIQHYEQSFNKLKTNKKVRTLQEEQENDKTKEKLAKENDIENYIVIDCRKSELEWIKNNIINSKLNELFDLSNINWLQCEEFALSNLVKKACEIKRSNPKMTTIEIGNIMNLTCVTISNYLKKGTKLGWCYYSIKEEVSKRTIKMGKLNRKSVEIFKNNISLGKFKSCSDLVKQSESLFGEKLLSNGISEVCNGKKEIYKGYTFKFN